MFARSPKMGLIVETTAGGSGPLMAFTDAELLRKEYLAGMQYLWDGGQCLSIIWGTQGSELRWKFYINKIIKVAQFSFQ